MASDKLFRQNGIFFASITFGGLLSLPFLPWLASAGPGGLGVVAALLWFALVSGFAGLVYYFLGMPILWGLQLAGRSNVWSYLLIGILFGILSLAALDLLVGPYDATDGAPNEAAVRSLYSSPRGVLLFSTIGGIGGAIFWFFVARPSDEQR